MPLRTAAVTVRARRILPAALLALACAGAATAATGSSVPKPRITAAPAQTTAGTTARFRFGAKLRDGSRARRFRCKLDNQPYAACQSPRSYQTLASGPHVFRVRTVAGVRKSAAAVYHWTVAPAAAIPQPTTAEPAVAAEPAPGPFPISGDVDGALAPGVTRPVTVTVANPFDDAIRVTRVNVSVEPGSSNAGCDGPANLEVLPSNTADGSVSFVVPPGARTVLPAPSTTPGVEASAPRVRMRNLDSNQDACKHARFALRFSGASE